MWRFGVSPKWIRYTFGTLTSLSMGEFLEVAPGYQVKAGGNAVHILGEGKEFIIQESPHTRKLYVQEKLSKMIQAEHYGENVTTQWLEVYREHEHVRSLEFVRLIDRMVSSARAEVEKPEASVQTTQVIPPIWPVFHRGDTLKH